MERTRGTCRGIGDLPLTPFPSLAEKQRAIPNSDRAPGIRQSRLLRLRLALASQLILCNVLCAQTQHNQPANVGGISAASVQQAEAALPMPSQSAGRATLSQEYGRLPLAFEMNKGQTAANVKLLSRGPEHSLFLTPAQAVLVLKKAQPGRQQRSRSSVRSSRGTSVPIAWPLVEEKLLAISA